MDLIRTFYGHEKYAYTAAFSPDGNTVASSSWDGTVRVWDVLTGEEKMRLGVHPGGARCAVFSPDGSVLATGDLGGAIRLWNSRTGERLKALKAHQRHLETLAFTPDGKRLASSSGDQTVLLWDTQTWEPERTLAGHTDDVGSVVFSPDGAMLITASDDNTVRLWDAETGNEIHRLAGHSMPALWATFSPDGSMVVSAGYIWDEAKPGDDKSTGEIRLWDVRTGACAETWATESSAVFCVQPLLGDRLLAGCADGQLMVWDLAAKRLLESRTAHSEPIIGIGISPDGTKAASAGHDAAIRLWAL